MEIIPLGLEGAALIKGKFYRDERGSFLKVFHQEAFTSLGLNTIWREHYWSTSSRGTIRGMHFQTPPADHAKLISCTSGRVQDAIIDLRKKSPTYGHSRTFILSENEGTIVYIPRGFAHGFLAIEDKSTLFYQVETVHSALHDCGINWLTCGVHWQLEMKNPIISDRDRSFPNLAAFNSPF